MISSDAARVAAHSLDVPEGYSLRERSSTTDAAKPYSASGALWGGVRDRKIHNRNIA